ncbi:hypothetical protein [Azotobacter vinelandii]
MREIALFILLEIVSKGRAACPKPLLFDRLTASWASPSGERHRGEAVERRLMADSVEKVGSAAASRSGVPAVEVAASHFKLPFGISLSVLALV